MIADDERFCLRRRILIEEIEEDFCDIIQELVVAGNSSNITEDHLNLVELDMLKMIKFHLERLVDIPQSFAKYPVINTRGIPSLESSFFWDFGSTSDFYRSFIYPRPQTGQFTLLWHTSIEQFKELGDGLNKEAEVSGYLRECSCDWREGLVVQPRYGFIEMNSLNENILQYIQHYYVARFKGPLKQWVEMFDIDFSPK